METFISDISKMEFPISERIPASTVRHSILALIRKDHPGFTAGKYISDSELNYYREKYISEYLKKEIGELTELEHEVLKSMSDKTILSDKSVNEDGQTLTLGQRIADKVASFGGSWKFIISFGFFLLAWITMNFFWLANRGFDPYPFILLNLILSCLAAIQAPVIMMSQNRQEEKDRERGKQDYMINLKSELEIRTLHEKLDHLIINQEQELLEIQKVQIEMMNDILERLEK
jgi:uncharacterized membrane protein